MKLIRDTTLKNTCVYIKIMADDYLEISKKIKEKFGEKVANIILFGSYARGDYSEESDIDILIIVKDKKLKMS